MRMLFTQPIRPRQRSHPATRACVSLAVLVRPDADPVFVLLPLPVYERLREPWSLPDLRRAGDLE